MLLTKCLGATSITRETVQNNTCKHICSHHKHNVHQERKHDPSFESPLNKKALCQVWSQLVSRGRTTADQKISLEHSTRVSKNHYILLEYKWFFLVKSWVPFTQGCFVLSFVEIDLLVLNKRTFKVCQCSVAFFLFPSLGTWCVLSFEQNWIHFNQGCFMPSLVGIGTLFLEKNIFLYPGILSMYVCYFAFIFRLKVRGTLFEQTWIPFSQLQRYQICQEWLKLSVWILE